MPHKDPATKKLYDRLYQKAHRTRRLAERRARYAADAAYRQAQIDAARAYRLAHANDPAYLERRRKASREYQRQKRAVAKLAAQAGTSTA